MEQPRTACQRQVRARVGDSGSSGLNSAYHSARGAVWVAQVDGRVPSICHRLTLIHPCAVPLSRNTALRTRPFSSIPVGGPLVFSQALACPDRGRSVERFAILSAPSLRRMAMGGVTAANDNTTANLTAASCRV